MEGVERLRTAGLRDTAVRLAILETIEPARGNRHHLVCRSCGAVADVGCSAGHAPCLETARGSGYDIHEAEVTFWGLCPACQDPGTTREAN